MYFNFIKISSRIALTAMTVSLLLACNENSSDPISQPDITKPVISVANYSLVNGVVLDATKPVSFTISPVGRIKATDNSGNVNLTVLDVVGLSKSQVVLQADGALVAKNITSTTLIGRGYVLLQAKDATGNMTTQKVYFDINPANSAAALTLTPEKSISSVFKVMENIRSAVLEMPTTTGVSASVVLADNLLTVNVKTLSTAVPQTLYPVVVLRDAEGNIYRLNLTLTVEKPAIPALVIPENSAWARLSDITIHDFAGNVPIIPIDASTGLANVTYSAIGLPPLSTAGMNETIEIDAETGVISGKYDALGNFIFTVVLTVKDKYGQTQSKTFVLTILNDG